MAAHQVDDLSKMYFDGALIEIGEVGRVVNELRELSLSHLGGAITEHEEQGIDRVRFARPVGPYDR